MTHEQLSEVLQEWWPAITFQTVGGDSLLTPQLRVKAIKTNAETGEQTEYEVAFPESLLDQPDEEVLQLLSQTFEPLLGPPDRDVRA